MSGIRKTIALLLVCSNMAAAISMKRNEKGQRKAEEVQEFRFGTTRKGTNFKPVEFQIDPEEPNNKKNVHSVVTRSKEKEAGEKKTEAEEEKKTEAEDVPDCAICLDAEENRGPLISLPCDSKHKFHVRCAHKWRKDNKLKCPVCRVEKDAGPESGIMQAYNEWSAQNPQLARVDDQEEAAAENAREADQRDRLQELLLDLARRRSPNGQVDVAEESRIYNLTRNSGTAEEVDAAIEETRISILRIEEAILRRFGVRYLHRS
jgi:hypothetical protein